MSWLWMVIGFIGMSVGVVLASIGTGLTFSSNIQLRYWPKKYGLWQLALGSVVAALGALSTTYAWDLRTLDNQREAMIQNLAIETMWNMQLLNRNAYTESNVEELTKFVVFPTLEDDALTEFLVSGLFLDPKYSKLHEEVLVVREIKNRFNNVFDALQLIMMRSGVTREEIVEIRQKATNSPQLKELRVSLGDLADTLQDTGIFRHGVTIKMMGEAKFRKAEDTEE